jgi:protein O-GlcNAc transferase
VHRGPSSPRIQELLAIALRHHQAGRLSEAEPLYREVLQAEPHHTDALHLLGVVAHQGSRNGQAVELISKAIARNPRVPAFHNNLGNALKGLGRLPQAAQSYRSALELRPDYVEALYNLGITLQAQEQWLEAAASYRRAIKLNPQHAEAHNNLGNTLQAQGRLEEAVISYRNALSCKPAYAQAYVNLGNVLRTQGQWDQALSAYSRALGIDPDSAEAHNNLGMVLQRQSKLDEAMGAYKRALSSRPDYAEGYNNLGNVLHEQGRAAEALAAYARALELKPDYAEAKLSQAVATIPILAMSTPESEMTGEQFGRALDELTAWDAAHPSMLGRSVGITQPFYLAYRPVDVTALLSRYGDLVCSAMAAVTGRHKVADVLRVTQPVTDRVRLGVVSGQVRRQHPVWEVVLRGIVARLDREQFEVFLYHTDSVADEETDWARSHVERFVQGPRSIQGWVDEISRDRPDVLFYPEVGMDPATCALAALRLAAVQVAGWGHPVTTGLPTMDLFVSGELIEAGRAQQHYREKLVLLPGTGVCTELTPVQAQRWDGPERPGGVVRFALCHQPIKFEPADDSLLVQIAKAAAPCELWLATPNKLKWTGEKLIGRLEAAFRAAGLDPEAHLRVFSWLPRGQFAGFLDEMDVYLDCPGFSGYTTAWQAVHRGLPIVTLEGAFMRQRLAAGLLRQIGVTQGVAASREEYVAIAARLATESRDAAQQVARRQAIQQAAPRADANRAAVEAFGRTLVDALRDLRALQTGNG